MVGGAAGAAARGGPQEVPWGEKVYPASASGLLRILEDEVRPWQAELREKLIRRPHLRAQALGESFEPGKLEALSRYEVHLDRNLERTLAMLLKLQDLRRDELPG